MEPTKERITGFDSLRFLMVFLVIALHSAMTYMAYAPEWWYVLDDRRSLFFAFLVVLLDSFPMSVLFFLAGYFITPSLNKRGKIPFIKDKFLRIGIPWALGVIFVAPFEALATAQALGYPPPDAFTFVTGYFLGPFYQQGHYWFLGVLFLFMACSAVFTKAPTKDTPVKPKPASNPLALLAGLWFVSTLTYYLSGRYVKPPVDWLNVGYIIYFQPARIVGYVGVFALGRYAWQVGWFKETGWSPDVPVWGVISTISGLYLVVSKFSLEWRLGELYVLVSEALAYNTTCISMTIFLSACFLKIKESSHWLTKLTKNFESDSYGIYWLHMIVLMPMLYILKPLDIPILIKWALSLPATVIICFAVLRVGKSLIRRVDS